MLPETPFYFDKSTELLYTAKDNIVNDYKSEDLDKFILSMVEKIIGEPFVKDCSHQQMRPGPSRVDICSSSFKNMYGEMACESVKLCLVQLRQITDSRARSIRALNYSECSHSSDLETAIMMHLVNSPTVPSSTTTCLVDWIVYEFLKEYCNVTHFIEQLSTASTASGCTNLLFQWLESIRRLDDERRAGLCPAGCIYKQSLSIPTLIGHDRVIELLANLQLNTERVRTFIQTLVQLLPTPINNCFNCPNNEQSFNRN